MKKLLIGILVSFLAIDPSHADWYVASIRTRTCEKPSVSLPFIATPFAFTAWAKKTNLFVKDDIARDKDQGNNVVLDFITIKIGQNTTKTVYYVDGLELCQFTIKEILASGRK